jgi:hypothetical protein
MPSWTPVVQCVRRRGEEPRFIVTDFDPKGPYIRGPDGGNDHAGYTESEIRAVLAERGLSDGAIESLIQRAAAPGESNV